MEGRRGQATDGEGVFQLLLHPVLALISGAFFVSNIDVVVWVQASSQGQHPAVHLQPSDTVVLGGTTQGWGLQGLTLFL